jgi:hypothetical protein
MYRKRQEKQRSEISASEPWSPLAPPEAGKPQMVDTDGGQPGRGKIRGQRAEDGGQKAEIASQGFRFQDPLKFRNEGW